MKPATATVGQCCSLVLDVAISHGAIRLEVGEEAGADVCIINNIR
jgi:hypothetical protein